MDETWRLIRTAAEAGPANMAMDEAILEAVRAGKAPPTLRLYAWEPGCITLGYGQRSDDVDHERLQAAGFLLTRRPTGGKAILHLDELTYAVIAPPDHPVMRGGVLESYRRLSAGLQRGLTRLGLDVEIQPGEKASDEDEENPVCFEVPSPYEITYGGKKLIGSAQLRRQGGVLQHGTLPISGDITRICGVLHYSTEAIRAAAIIRLRDRATTLEEAAGKNLSWEEVADAVGSGLQQAVGAAFSEGALTRLEIESARHLTETRYVNQEWIERR